MKHTARIAAFAALFTASVPLSAADAIEVPWNKVCEVSNGREITLTTANGGTVQGYCISTDVNEIAVTTRDRRVIKVARSALNRLQMRRSKGHQLRALHKGVHSGLRVGFDALFSPLAPVGLVVVPGTLAWAAVSAPFCLLGDLKDKADGQQEIKLI